jgi:hypothetical protein
MTATINQTQTQSETSKQLLSMPGILLRLEGLAVLLTALVLYSQVSGDWLLFVVLLLAPDLAALGYLVNVRVGSVTYNIAHYFGLPLALGLVSLLGGWALGLSLALIWAAHIGMDRVFGYGFKYATSFKDTHLGRI